MFSSPALLGSVLAASSLVHAATRQFSIQAAWGIGAPDGFERQMILVNGASPGPALIVDQGDDVEFYVQNDLDRPATVHFHGIEQLDTPWSDGVPGLSQKPIPPGGSWLYKWKATEYGAYWYHAHYQSLVSDGFFGPIYVRPRSDIDKPFAAIGGENDALLCAEEQPQFVMVADWQHVTAEELYQIEQDTNIDIYCAQSILINGQGRVNCLTPEQQMAALAPTFQGLYTQGPLAGNNMTASGCAPFIPVTQAGGDINPAGLPETITGCTPTNSELHNFKVDPSKGFANFHLMSATSILDPVVSLDEHDMWVYAIDGRYIEPYKVQSIQIYNGDRYSVFVPLTKGSGTFTLRANHFGFNQLLGGFASVTYETGSFDDCPSSTGSDASGGSDTTPGDTIPTVDPRSGSDNNGHLDCGIPGWVWPISYGSEPDGTPEKVSDWQPPYVPSDYDWLGDMLSLDGDFTDTAASALAPTTSDGENTVTIHTTTTASCTTVQSSSATGLPYVKRADQFRGGLWRRQALDNATSYVTSQPWITYGGAPISTNVTQLNETFVVPFPNIPPALEVSATHIFSMSRTTAPYLWKLGGESYPSHPQEYSEDEPLLYYPYSTNAQNDNLVVQTTNDTWVDLIFTVPDTFGPPHPMHKHSNKAYVIGRGTGNFTWNNVAEAAAAQPQNFNFVNPQYRDGYNTAPSAGTSVWLAVRYHVVNPGAFLLHCHVQTHLTGGMAIAILDAPGDFPLAPAEYGVNGVGF